MGANAPDLACHVYHLTNSLFCLVAIVTRPRHDLVQFAIDSDSALQIYTPLFFTCDFFAMSGLEKQSECRCGQPRGAARGHIRLAVSGEPPHDGRSITGPMWQPVNMASGGLAVGEDGTLAGPCTSAPAPTDNDSDVPAGPPSDLAQICAAGSLLASILDTQHTTLMTSLSPIAEELALLRDAFAKRMSYDSTKEDAFSRLYRELNDSREEQRLHQFRPIYLDLILLLDRIDQNRTAIATTTLSYDDFTTLLTSLYDEILEILSRGEVEPLTLFSSKFDPANQRAVGVEPVHDPQEHQDVASVVRRGFTHRHRVLRPEEVVIKTFTSCCRS